MSETSDAGETDENRVPGPGTGGEPADPARADEPDQLPEDSRRGAAADDAGGSVAESIRTPSPDQEEAEAEALEDFDEHG